MATAKVSASDILLGVAAPQERSFRNKILGLICLLRLGFDIAILPMVLGVAALAGAPVTAPVLVPVCIVALIGVGVVAGTNDIIDAERDKQKWPKKPLPTGLISKPGAILFIAILYLVMLAIAGLAVSWLFAVAVLVAMVLNYVYSAYSRDHIGYVTVIYTLVTLPALVFVAVSPGTFLTTLAGVVFIYFAAVGLAAEITHEALDPKIPALIVRPRPTVEQALYVVLVIVGFLTGMWIFLYAHLSLLFLVPVTVFTVLFLNNAKVLGKNRSREKLESAYKIITIYYICIFWIFTAFFVWIPHVGIL